MAGGGSVRPEGAGSVWNQGNWSWEEKNYTTWAHEAIRQKLLAISVEGAGVTVKLTEVSELKGDATLNIRKGRKMMIFALHIKGKWEGRAVGSSGGEGSAVEGTLEIFDLVPDELSEDFPIEVRTTKESASVSLTSSARRLMDSEGRVRVRAAMREFAAELMERDGGAEALERDRQRRAEALAATAAAVGTAAVAAGAVERSVSAAVRKGGGGDAASGDGGASPVVAASATAPPKPVPIATAASSAAAAAAPSASAAAPAAAAAGGGGAGGAGASAWNTSSYAWEEKNWSPWAKERFSELIKGVEFEVPGGLLKVVNIPKFEGDAYVNLRKGRKILIFEFNIEAEWEGELVGKDGSVTATGDGKFILSDWDQDTPVDEATIRVEDSGTAVDKSLADVVRSHGVRELRAKLATLLEELRQK